MSLLFTIRNNAVYPNAETLMVRPFSEIWERDESPNKEIALKEFAYIEFSTSMLASNPFREYSEAVKEGIIKEEIFRDADWQPDSLIIEAKLKIEEFQTNGSISYTYWLSNKTAIDKMKKFFDTFDISERDEKGKPIWKPKDITNAIKDAEQVIKALDVLKSKVDEGIYESNKVRGNKEISPFAKRSSIKK